MTDAPQQTKQPSRKGKKAWRKNVDISEVQAGLQRVRDEEITDGGVFAERPAEALFTVDTTGSRSTQPASTRYVKPLRADQILGMRSAVPSVRTHERAGVTNGTVTEPESKRQKRRNERIRPADYDRLRKLVYGKQSITDIVQKPSTTTNVAGQEIATYDAWGNEPSMDEQAVSRFTFLEKPQQRRAPATLKEKPISLLTRERDLARMSAPRAGTSYNPDFDDWNELVDRQGAKEVTIERARLAKEDQDREHQDRVEQAGQEPEEVVRWIPDDEESAWEGVESELDTSDAPPQQQKRPQRKTLQERKRAERRKERERLEKAQRKEKERAKREQQIRRLKAEVDREDAARRKLRRDAAQSTVATIDDDGDDDRVEIVNGRSLRRRCYGKNAVPPSTLDLVLPEELQDSLRMLKPEGNLLTDRYRDILLQGKVEARRRANQQKKKKVKATEKWSYKDWTVTA